MNKQLDILGVTLPNGSRITHGAGGNVKKPLDYSPAIMHELYSGDESISFEGQFGFIEFNPDCRLPRHVHMALNEKTGEYRVLAERILVLNGVAVTELCGKYYVIAPGTLVDIAPGVPHTWNACPAGVKLPDGSVSDGSFTMVYNYSEVTKFFPTSQTELLESSADYIPFFGDIEDIRFPVMTSSDVINKCHMVWDDKFYERIGNSYF